MAVAGESKDIQKRLVPDEANLVHEWLSSTEVKLALPEIESGWHTSEKIPLDQLAGLGAGLAQMFEALRGSASVIEGAPRLIATDKNGIPIDLSRLMTARDGSGMIGAMSDDVTGLAQARFHVVDAPSVVTFSPHQILMTVAMAQIGKQLGTIQKTVDEVFEYMRQKDSAEQRANITALQQYLADYRYNWGNAMWMANAHKEAMEIKRGSEAAIGHLRSQVESKLGSKPLFELRVGVAGRLGEMLDRLKEYQVALYAYSFSSFMEPMLSENFDGGYLAAITDSIRERGYAYRELYSRCYDEIESATEKSADKVVLGGVAGALSGLGGFVKGTPLGDATFIDEALQDAGGGLAGMNDSWSDDLLSKLRATKEPDVLPFIKGLESVSSLRNRPHRLMVDESYAYLMEEEDREEA